MRRFDYRSGAPGAPEPLSSSQQQVTVSAIVDSLANAPSGVRCPIELDLLRLHHLAIDNERYLFRGIVARKPMASLCTMMEAVWSV
jgi:hypothetical protein